MKKISPGALAALLVTALLAAPAYAAPANVTVRVEGENQTLVPRTAIRTADAAVAGDPNSGRSCRGTGAMGAIDRATGGDYAGYWDGNGFFLTTIKGEFHNDPFPADPARYWSFWVNYRHMDVGLCDPSFELQEGDDVIILVDCYSAVDACEPASPLRLSGVPPSVAPGQTVTVRVDEYGVEDPAAFPTVTTSGPAAGATVSYGGQTATTRPDGTAELTFPTPGPVSIETTKPGRVRTAALTCVTSGADGNCGTQLPVLGTEAAGDRTAPRASFRRLRHHEVYKRKRAPRRIAGRVTPDPSGLEEVRLSIKRRVDGRCSRYSGSEERFKRSLCDGWRSFAIGDRAEWSYLLPKRLGKGRYAIRAVAVDKAGNDSVAKVVIHVR